MTDHTPFNPLTDLPRDGMEAAALVLELLHCWRSLDKPPGVKATPRSKADARERVAEIAARERLLREYLERSRDGRRFNFDRLFTLADEALERGDSDDLVATTQAIGELARSTPFHNMA